MSVGESRSTFHSGVGYNKHESRVGIDKTEPQTWRLAPGADVDVFVRLSLTSTEEISRSDEHDLDSQIRTSKEASIQKQRTLSRPH